MAIKPPAPVPAQTARHVTESLLSLAFLLLAFLSLGAVTSVQAQISLTSAADLALRNSPRVKMAQAALEKAQAGVSEATNVYIPTLTGGSGLGYSYGFPIGQPTLFNFQSTALVYSSTQSDYIRAARAGLRAATLSLMDARQTVAGEVALAFIALERDQKRNAGLADEMKDAQRLETIIQERANAGQDTAIVLTSTQLTLAQLRLDVLHAQDEESSDRARLARLMGLPVDALRVSEQGFPAFPSQEADTRSAGNQPLSPGIQAAYAQAAAKAQIARGDARYLYFPQISFGAEYDRFTTYNNYNLYYQHFQVNNAEIGIQIKVPLFDRNGKAKARDSAAEASRALHQADLLRDQFLDGRLTLSHSAKELAARAEIAKLEQQLAQQQLNAMLVQASTIAANGAPQMTPKDEQNARIAERQKYLALVDATFDLEQAEINLLHQNGELEAWLKSSATLTSTPTTAP